MKINPLTRKEMTMVEQLFTQLCGSPNALDKALNAQFGDKAAEVRTELETGVDQFYMTMKGNVDGKTLEGLLVENMKDMSPRQKFVYLSNLMLALNQVCGNIIEGAKWNDALEAHKAVLAGLEGGVLDEKDPGIQKVIDEMLHQIVDQADAFSVLLIGEPPYEALMEACLSEDPAKVQALAANTREAALNMAASVYLLQEQGKLESLPQGKIHPRDTAVMTASVLEMDAAFKSGTWDTAKVIVEKAVKTAISLLVASPAILGEGMVILALLTVFTSFSKLWLLLGGAILFINARIHTDLVSKNLQPALNAGMKVLNTTMNKVLEVSAGFRQWISTEIMPRVLPAWNKFSDYVTNMVILPAMAFIMRLPEKLGDAYDKVMSWFDNLKERAMRHEEQISRKNPLRGTAQTTPVSQDNDDAPIVIVDDETHAESVQPRQASNDVIILVD